MITLVKVPAFILGFMTRVPKRNRGISVGNWLKANGESVTEGETIVVLDTRKAAVEVAALASGLLFHLVKVDEKVKVGDILGVLADSAEEFQEYTRQGLTSHVA